MSSSELYFTSMINTNTQLVELSESEANKFLVKGEYSKSSDARARVMELQSEIKKLSSERDAVIKEAQYEEQRESNRLEKAQQAEKISLEETAVKGVQEDPAEKVAEKKVPQEKPAVANAHKGLVNASPVVANASEVKGVKGSEEATLKYLNPAD